MAENKPHITHTEWATIAPAMMQMITAGPGVAPAEHMASHVEDLLSFSNADAVIDMGCGPGQVTNALLKLHHDRLAPSAKVIGADFNMQMLEQYRARQKSEIEQGNTYWQSAQTVEVDVNDCAVFEDDSISHMLCGFLLFILPEPAKAISAIKRVMKPGGVLAISSMTGNEWGKLSMYPLKVRPDLTMTVPMNSCTSADDVTKHLEAAGFKDIEVVQIQNYMYFDDYDIICRFLLTKLPMAARAVSQMSNEEVLKTHELMVADLKSWHPTLPAKMIGQVNIAYCRK